MASKDEDIVGLERNKQEVERFGGTDPNSGTLGDRGLLKAVALLPNGPQHSPESFRGEGTQCPFSNPFHPRPAPSSRSGWRGDSEGQPEQP